MAGAAGDGTWLLLAVTNHITQNIASIPFLWMLPLTRTRDLHHLLRSRALVPSRRLGGAGAGPAGRGRLRAADRQHHAERRSPWRTPAGCSRGVSCVTASWRGAGLARSDDVLPDDRKAGGALEAWRYRRRRDSWPRPTSWGRDADGASGRRRPVAAVRARPAGRARHRGHVRLLRTARSRSSGRARVGIAHFYGTCAPRHRQPGRRQRQAPAHQRRDPARRAVSSPARRRDPTSYYGPTRHRTRPGGDGSSGTPSA